MASILHMVNFTISPPPRHDFPRKQFSQPHPYDFVPFDRKPIDIHISMLLVRVRTSEFSILEVALEKEAVLSILDRPKI